MRTRRERGFTLIELMITIAILGVGMALALPAFRETIRSNQVATASNAMIAAVNLARTEAIRSNRGGILCASSTGSSCDGTNWNAGILVFTDADGSGAWSSGDTAVRFYEANGAINFASSSDATVAFDRRGRTSSNVEITLQPKSCTSGASQKRRLYIKMSGQTRLTKEAC